MAFTSVTSLAGFEHSGGDACHVGRQQDVLDASGAESTEQALDHGGLLGTRINAGIGRQAAHIAARRRVGDDPHGQRGFSHGTPLIIVCLCQSKAGANPVDMAAESRFRALRATASSACRRG